MNFEEFNAQHTQLDELLYEEGLRDWFGKSKSKDGKKGWVNVVTGDSCASDKPGEGIPKCVSSSKRASMSKSERKAAAAAKRREDPGQQSKSGASKPTNVKTDRNVKEEYKDPIHYALKSDKELMKLHTKDDKKKKKDVKEEAIDEACWKGYEKKGMKTMFGKRYPNCVKKTKKEEVEMQGEIIQEKGDMSGMTQKGGHKRSTESGAGLTQKGVEKYRRQNPGSKLKTAVTTPPSKLDPDSKAAKRRKSFCARSRGWTGERGKAARRRWNCSYEMEGENFLGEMSKLGAMGKALKGKAVTNAAEIAGDSKPNTAKNIATSADKGSTVGNFVRSQMGKMGGNLGRIAGKTSGLGTALGIGAGIGQAYKNNPNRAAAVSGRGAGRATFNSSSNPSAKLDP